MSEKIEKKISLLKNNGTLTKECWSCKDLILYNKKQIHGNKLLVKEWDKYFITNQNEKFSIELSIKSSGLFLYLSIIYIDYNVKKAIQLKKTALLSFDFKGFEGSSLNNHFISTSFKNIRISFIIKNGKHHLIFGAPNFKLPDGKIGLSGDLILTLSSNKDKSICISTKNKDSKTSFYLSENINNFDISGVITRGYNKNKTKSLTTFGALDWGRSKLQNNLSYIHAIFSGMSENEHFGLTIAYAISKKINIDESAIFYKNKVYKLTNIKIKKPNNLYTEDWIIKYKSKPESKIKIFIDIKFTPQFSKDRNTKNQTNNIIIDNFYGYISGKIFINNKIKIFTSNILGFIEKCTNR